MAYRAPDYAIRAAGKNALGDLIRKSSSNVSFASVKAVDGGTRGSLNLVRILAAGLQKQFSSTDDLIKIHSTVADAMRQSVKSSFEQTVKTHTGQYRTGDNRFSGGALKRAIMAPSLAVGTASGINFVDEQRLDQEAEHWRRLNFGALGYEVGERSVENFPFRFNNITLYTVAFTARTSPAFVLPPGLWMTPEGKWMGGDASRKSGAGVSRTGVDKFFPGGKGSMLSKILGGDEPRVTRGITPRNFLDAGLKRMVKDLPVAYTTMIDGWLNDAEKSVQLPPKVVIRAGVQGRYGGFVSTAP